MTSRDELSRRAWSALAQVFFGDEMHDRFHSATAAAGLPHPGALKALLTLDVEDSRSMRSLAQVMRCDASYVTALVDALENLGYVERQASQTDRRVKLVALTAKGQRAQDEAREVLSQPPKALGDLTDAEVRTLAKIAAKLASGS
jgi:DNA-binding MarR family transcriptional regulator